MQPEKAIRPDFSRDVDGPFVITFTAHLPFPVGIPNDVGHSIWLSHAFVDERYRTTFPRPFVNIRVFDLPQSGLPVWQQGTNEALKHFYNHEPERQADERYGEDAFTEHNQWVTLETPYGDLEGYEADPFHRCLGVFNGFLQATLLITRDIRIRTIASHDLRPIVVIGAWPQGETWRELSSMYMHPGATPESVLTVDKPFDQDQLNSAMNAIVTQKPYITTIMWRARAQRALRQTGDSADAVISFQVAAESLLFETYRMLLVDEGMSSNAITTELEKDRPFKRFFTDIYPARLGGDWQLNHRGKPIGNYWTDLYEVRNSIIHTGMLAHTGHAEAAQTAYWGLRDHLEARLWANHRTYPRTVFARLGEEQLKAKGWHTAWMRQFIEGAESESGVWYWPWDVANRPQSSNK